MDCSDDVCGRRILIKEECFIETGVRGKKYIGKRKLVAKTTIWAVLCKHAEKYPLLNRVS